MAQYYNQVLTGIHDPWIAKGFSPFIHSCKLSSSSKYHISLSDDDDPPMSRVALSTFYLKLTTSREAAGVHEVPLTANAPVSSLTKILPDTNIDVVTTIESLHFVQFFTSEDNLMLLLLAECYYISQSTR